MVNVQELYILSNQLRRDSLEMTSAAGSGHPTSCLSAADIVSVLFFDHMRFDVKNVNNPNNDSFILSKGHAAPLWYSALKHAGCISTALNSYRKHSSILEGHPIPHNPWISAATGSLGQGLSVGAGMALAAKMHKKDSRSFVLLGDSELAEGSIYEACQLASFYKLDNLIAIADINRLGQRGETMFGHDLLTYKARFLSLGWAAEIINGHDISAIKSALQVAHPHKPLIILARTHKGKGVSFLENKESWHGKVLDKKELSHALAEIPQKRLPFITIEKPAKSQEPQLTIKLSKSLLFEGKIATREAYGRALANLAKHNPSIIAIDAEVSNSTFSELVKKETPKQFIEAFVAEQNMIGMTQGLSAKGFKPFASTFAAFLTRAHDQLRMASISKANFVVCGSHAGVSIGADGASQMGLDDISLFRDLPNSTILYPSDAYSTQAAVNIAAKNQGITYIRTTRAALPLLYDEKDSFSLEDFKVLKESKEDSIVLIGAGITVHESLKAVPILKTKRIHAAVVDIFSIKPLDTEKLASFIKSHGNRVLITEDHYEAGGIGELLSSAFSGKGIIIERLAVKGIPHSGTMEELLHHHKIDFQAIATTAYKMMLR